MYYFQLMGGLGNQLFQYAAAKALYLKTDVPFKVYYEDGNAYAQRSFQLEKFNIPVEKAREKEIPKKTFLAKVKRKLHITIPFFNEKQDFDFDPLFFRQKLNTHFHGYWQNEKYFKEHRAILISEYQLKNPPGGMNKKCLTNIEQAINSIAIHVRRGDYIENPIAYANHGLCDLDYYKKAVRYFEENHERNQYFLFSDDVDWVRENLNFIENKTIIDWNAKQPEEDLRLMSSCKHQIIANSSFSWWGAWLNTHPDQVVIAPKQWTRKQHSKAILPNSWLTY